MCTWFTRYHSNFQVKIRSVKRSEADSQGPYSSPGAGAPGGRQLSTPLSPGGDEPSRATILDMGTCPFRPTLITRGEMRNRRGPGSGPPPPLRCGSQEAAGTSRKSDLKKRQESIKHNCNHAPQGAGRGLGGLINGVYGRVNLAGPAGTLAARTCGPAVTVTCWDPALRPRAEGRVCTKQENAVTALCSPRFRP